MFVCTVYRLWNARRSFGCLFLKGFGWQTAEGIFGWKSEQRNLQTVDLQEEQHMESWTHGGKSVPAHFQVSESDNLKRWLFLCCKIMSEFSFCSWINVYRFKSHLFQDSSSSDPKISVKSVTINPIELRSIGHVRWCHLTAGQLSVISQYIIWYSESDFFFSLNFELWFWIF